MLKQAAEAEKQKRLNEFLSENPSPTDEQVHALAGELGLEPDDLEEMIYDTLAAYVAGNDQMPGGLADNVDDSEFDPGQLSMGEEVEMEHTDNPDMAGEIAADHLAEIPDYYSRLDEMESEAKEGEEDEAEGEDEDDEEPEESETEEEDDEEEDDEDAEDESEGGEKKESRRKTAAEMEMEWDDDSVAAEMAVVLDVDPDELDVSVEYNFWTVRLGDREWMVFADYREAEKAAWDRVKEDLESDPTMFSQDWLRQFVYMTDIDARLSAQDLVGDYAEEMDEDRVYEELGVNPEEMDIDTAREELTEKMENDIEQKLKSDPIGYLVEDQGIYTIEDLMQSNFINIDTHEAATSALREDGVAHFLASYDGEENESENGLIYYQVN